MLPRTLGLAELLNFALARGAEQVRVFLPGRVERYDAATQLADVQPLVKDLIENDEGVVESFALPVVTNVPVIFPGAGGFHITFPVRAGDTVALLFADRSLDAWLAQGGVSDPADQRRHHLSDAVAIVGLHPNNAPVTGVDADVITIGSDAGTTDFAATAQRVLTELNKLKSAYDAHTHIISGTSAAAGAPIVAVNSAGPTSAALAAPASATVKVKG